MTALVERLLPLWTQPVRDRPDAEAAFAEVYADPVTVNGAAMTIAELAGRARSLQQAFDRLSMDVIDIVEAPGRIVLAFIMRGRQAGPYLSPLGTVAPTYRDIEVRTIDVLTIANGLISAIWVVSDDLALLRQLDAVTLAASPHPAPLRLMGQVMAGGSAAGAVAGGRTSSLAICAGSGQVRHRFPSVWVLAARVTAAHDSRYLVGGARCGIVPARGHGRAGDG